MTEYYIKILNDKSWVIYDNNHDILTDNNEEKQTENIRDDIKRIINMYKIKNLIQV